MPVVHHEPQRLPVQRGGADGPAGWRHRCGQGEIGGAGGEFRKAAVAGALAEVELRLRVAAPECADEQGQRRLAERVLEGDGDPAAHHLRFMPDKVKAGTELGERGFHIGQQRRGGRRQPDSPAVPDQQLGSHHGAGARQRTADRRLRNAEQLSGFGDVLRPPKLRQQRQDRQQLHQLPVLDIHWFSSVNSIRFMHELLTESCIGY